MIVEITFIDIKAIRNSRKEVLGNKIIEIFYYIRADIIGEIPY